ncbi:MOSC domain-containing protein [Dehalococcoidia bacterium]|nr:MOSC domain-containing protein [Dehalococcoidia bacterium]
MEAKAQGTVVAVSMSPNGGVPKYPQASVTIGDLGVDGDYHSGPINRHKKTEPPEPNSRQITLVAHEVLEEVNTQLGIMLKPGDLGENILVSGLDDLRQLRKGDRIMLGTDVVLEITAQNNPCNVLSVYHPAIVKKTTGRRGVTAIVLRTGSVRPGDPCMALGRSDI